MSDTCSLRDRDTCDTIWYCVIRRDTMWYDVIRHDTHDTMWYDVIRCDTVWYVKWQFSGSNPCATDHKTAPNPSDLLFVCKKNRTLTPIYTLYDTDVIQCDTAWYNVIQCDTSVSCMYHMYCVCILCCVSTWNRLKRTLYSSVSANFETFVKKIITKTFCSHLWFTPN